MGAPSLPCLAWIGGPMLFFRNVAIGLWFNTDLARWRETDDDSGMWFGKRSFVETTMDGSRFRRSIIALGLVALVRNELLE